MSEEAASTAPGEATQRRQRPRGKLDSAARNLEALNLRLSGLTYEAIAERMEFADRGGAFRAVERAIRLNLTEPAEDARSLELRRLDALLAAVWPRALTGDDFAVDRALKLSARRAKLLGLDAPERHEVAVQGEIVLDVVGTSVEPAPLAPAAEPGRQGEGPEGPDAAPPAADSEG